MYLERKQYRSVFLFSILLIAVLAPSFAQIANKRLYLKTGNGLSRVVPTSSTIQSTPSLFKQTAVLGVNGNFKTANGGSTAGTLTSAAFTPTGSNRLLLVSIGSVVGANNAVTAVTFGGVSFTKLTESVSAGFKVEFWFLKNPVASSGTINFTWPTGNNLEATLGYSCLSNVDLSATFLTPAAISGSTASSSLNVLSTPGDIVVDAVAVKDNIFTAGAGQTQLFSDGTNSIDIRSSWKQATTGGATQTNMAWNGLNAAWVAVGVRVKGLSNISTFTQNPTMCSSFTVKSGQTISIVAHCAVTANTASGATLPLITELSSGGVVFFTSTSAANAGLGATGTTGTLTWTGTIPSDVVIPANQAVVLNLYSDYSAADIRIDFDATSKISYLELPTNTYINVNSLLFYTAPFSGGTMVTQRAVGVTNYIRSVVSDPFGSSDITGLDIRVNGGAALAATSVATAGCTRTYEYAWTPSLAGNYTIQATAKEGTENTVTHSSNAAFIVVRPSVSIAVTKSAPVGAVTINNNITYNIAITNTGLSSIATLPLQDIFPSASLQYLSASIAPNSTSVDLLTWNNILGASLAAGATTNVTVTFRVLSNNNPLNNTARVEGAIDNLGYSAAAASNTLSLTVDNVPDAVIDYNYVQASTAIDVLSNDRDADVVGSLTANSAAYNVTIDQAPSVGTASVNVAKTIQFNPIGMVEDQLTSFRYRVTEIATGLWDTATVFVRFSAINSSPVAVNDIAATIVGEPVIINVLINDNDVDGVLQNPTINTSPKYGTAIVNPDRTITYTPFSGFAGNDTIRYQICDNGFPVPALCSQALVVVSVSNAIVVCQESTQTFTASAVAGAISYTWTIPAGATVTSPYSGSLPNPVTNGTSITINWNGVSPGTTSICARPTNNCGDGSSQCVDVSVTRVQLSTLVTPVGCRNARTGAIDLTLTGGRTPYNIAWTGPSGYVAAIEDISGLASGTYNVSVIDKYGCVAGGSAVINQPASGITVNGVATSENPFGSFNGSINATVSGGTTPYAYLWSTGAVTEDISNLGGGTYTLTATNARGCSAAAMFTVQAVGGPLTISSLIKSDVLCRGGSTGTVDLEVTGGSGSYTYAWTGPSGFTATTQDLTGRPAGTYNVTVNDGTTTVSGLVTINQPAVSLTASSVSTPVLCNGASTGGVTVTVSGGTPSYTYLWNTGATSKDLVNVPAGSYAVIVTDANGCTANTAQVISQLTALSLTQIITNSTCASGNSGIVNITPSGGTPAYSFAWSNGASTEDVSGLATGTYSVVVTDANGCKLGRSFVVYNSCLGVAKSITGTPLNNGNGTYNLSYTIKIENKGNATLQQVQATDNLTNTFTGATSFNVVSVTSTAFTVNPAFNGTSNVNLLSAPLPTLAAGESGFVNINVSVTLGTKLGIYNNSVISTAQDTNGTVVSDSSQSGSNTDPDNDGRPTNNNAPTPITFVETPVLGVAKALTASPINNGDGSYTLSYAIRVRNFGDVPLHNVQVSDDLSATFSGASVTVLSLTSSGLTVNNAFNGTSNKNLLVGTDNLAIDTTRTINLSLRVRPGSLATYFNSAVGSASGPGGTATTDSSQNGIASDPDNDGNPKNNNVPTPVTFNESPAIALAKRLVGAPVNLHDGRYQLQYAFVLRNDGNVPLKQIQLTDNLATTFPGKTVGIDSIVTTGGLTKNVAFNGTTVTQLLSGTDTLAIDSSAMVRLFLKVTPGTNLGVYNNAATASANGPLGTATNDISHNGSDPDPENDGAGNNSTPTPVSFSETPFIGLAKRVVSTQNNSDGTYTVTYQVRVWNRGDVPLKDVQVIDSISRTFIGATSFAVSSVAATAPLVRNNGYNGTIDNHLLQTPNQLPAGDSSTITLVMNLTPGTKLGVYNNTAFGQATSTGGSAVADSSMNGTLADPDNDGNPGNNNEPTPLTLNEKPTIGLAKRIVGAISSNGSGSYTFTYEIKVQNVGNVPLAGVQIADDLASAFPSPVTFSVNSVVVNQQPAGSTLVVNGSYNGLTQNYLLDGNGTMAVGTTALIRVNITVQPGSLGGPFFNTANGFGVSPAGNYSIDRSQNGSNIDADGDSDPSNDNEPTPVSFVENPAIGTAKSLVSVLDSTNGMNTVTFRIDVKNFGNVILQDIALFDDIATQFASVSPANFVAEQGSLFTNPSWNGTAASNLLAGGQSLAVGDSGYVFVHFTVIPGRDSVFYNTAWGRGTSYNGLSVTDTSTNGLQPDADGNGDPATDSVPTPVILLLHIPFAVNDSFATPQDTPLNGDVTGNDKLSSDGGNSWSLVGLQGGALHGTVVMNANGSFIYTPATGFTGIDSFTYRICDLNNDCDTAVVFITILTINQPPIAVYDIGTTIQNIPVTIQVLANDSDPDNDLHPGSMTITAQPLHGVVTIDTLTGSITYTPASGFWGKDTLVYSVCDSGSPVRCDTAIVYLTVLKDGDKDGVSDVNDIDDDNDGITDYLEVCGAGAISWTCTPGNSNPSADDDNDGILNYRDSDFGILNAAGTVASLDADGDGVPNYLDLDSDNDGISDVVESLGADANGDGLIDNYSDTDGDGFSQNVDGSTSGESGSGFGIGVSDFDGDGIPNFLDLDADNDGVPDVLEANGADVNNDGRADNYIDADGDGWLDSNDGDEDNDGIIENVNSVLVLTGPDTNGDGRPDYYTIRGNTDNSGKPNFLDLDSDNDGITDATESGITAASFVRGMVSGCALVNGWCSLIDNLVSLVLPNADGSGRADAFDIDSDNDGISDNIEGMSTNSYAVPVEADTDGDGISDAYDLFNGVGGNGITPYDHDFDGIPDYQDSDTDGDGVPDRNESDKRYATLSQATINASGDLDGDGLMDFFDIFDLISNTGFPVFRNVGANNFGPGGNINGPAPGGANVEIVKSSALAPDRDWRNVSLLSLNTLILSGNKYNGVTNLSWLVSDKSEAKTYVIERSTDAILWKEVKFISPMESSTNTFNTNDSVTELKSTKLIYRIKQINKSGVVLYSNLVAFGNDNNTTYFKAYPNPVKDVLMVQLNSTASNTSNVLITDLNGRVVMSKTVALQKGMNSIRISDINKLASGVYFITVSSGEGIFRQRIMKE